MEEQGDNGTQADHADQSADTTQGAEARLEVGDRDSDTRPLQPVCEAVSETLTDSLVVPEMLKEEVPDNDRVLVYVGNEESVTDFDTLAVSESVGARDAPGDGETVCEADRDEESLPDTVDDRVRLAEAVDDTVDDCVPLTDTLDDTVDVGDDETVSEEV